MTALTSGLSWTLITQHANNPIEYINNLPQLINMQQKAAIEMSLGIIVALVFAVILLSLALIWVQGMFKNIGDVTHKVTDVAKQQLMQELAGGSRVGIAAPAVTTWARGETGSYALGIMNQNPDQDKRFYINIYLDKYNSGTGMLDCKGTTSCPDAAEWLTFSTSELIPKGESKASDIIIEPTTNAQTGTYMFRAVVCETSGCIDITSANVYGDETFSIKIESV